MGDSDKGGPPDIAPASVIYNGKNEVNQKMELENENNEEFKECTELETLRIEAEECLIQLEPDQAKDLLQKALEIDPNDVHTLDLMAQTAIELADHDLAHQMLQRSTSLKPDENPTKWMYYGQLQNGMDAIKSFQKGISLMLLEQKSGLSSQDQEYDSHTVSKRIASGYCSMAEIYTTDLCDEANAESECERLLSLAIDTDEKNCEAHLTLSNLRLIQGRNNEANECLQKCLDLLPIESDEGDDKEEEGDESEFQDDLAYNFKLNVAKMCIELKRYDDATNVFEGLLTEDDSYVEVWYLIGMCYHELKEDDSASQYLTKAESMLLQLEDVAEAKELLVLVQKLIKQLPEGLVAKAMAEWAERDMAKLSMLPDDDDEEMTKPSMVNDGDEEMSEELAIKQ